MNEKQARELMVTICQKIWQQGWVAANDGNVSVKLDDGTFLTTPNGISKSFITEEKIIHIKADGTILQAEEGLKPSSEFPMHMRCYTERADVGAVVHAHPPVATGFAIANIPLDMYTMTEAVVNLGCVPIAEFGTPSTDEVPESIVPFLQDHDAVLLKNHGALTVGTDLIKAYYNMETLELYAKVTYYARMLGGEKEMTRDQIDKCLDLRNKFNMKGRNPGYRKYSKK